MYVDEVDDSLRHIGSSTVRSRIDELLKDDDPSSTRHGFTTAGRSSTDHINVVDTSQVTFKKARKMKFMERFDKIRRSSDSQQEKMHNIGMFHVVYVIIYDIKPIYIP